MAAMETARLTTDAAAYPPYDEVLATYRDLRAENLARLEAIKKAVDPDRVFDFRQAV